MYGDGDQCALGSGMGRGACDGVGDPDGCACPLGVAPRAGCGDIDGAGYGETFGGGTGSASAPLGGETAEDGRE